LPKVLSSYPLSPQRGERVRVRGEEKTFGNKYNFQIFIFQGIRRFPIETPR